MVTFRYLDSLAFHISACPHFHICKPYVHGDVESQGPQMWKSGNMESWGLQMWKCGTLGACKCGNVESLGLQMWKRGKLLAADVESVKIWTCENVKYDNSTHVDSLLAKCWGRSENRPTFHIHTLSTSHHNPTTLFSFSKKNLAKAWVFWRVA